MAIYNDLPNEQIEKIAGTIADILQSLGYGAMATDCRGDRRDAGLSRYAQITIRLMAKTQPLRARRLEDNLRQLGVVA